MALSSPRTSSTSTAGGGRGWTWRWPVEEDPTVGRFVVEKKLDGVCPDDNRPSNN